MDHNKLVQLVHDLNNFRLVDELGRRVFGMSDLLALIVVLVHNLVVALVVDDGDFVLVVVKIVVVMFEGKDCIKQFLVIAIEYIVVH